MPASAHIHILVHAHRGTLTYALTHALSNTHTHTSLHAHTCASQAMRAAHTHTECRSPVKRGQRRAREHARTHTHTRVLHRHRPKTYKSYTSSRRGMQHMALIRWQNIIEMAIYIQELAGTAESVLQCWSLFLWIKMPRVAHHTNIISSIMRDHTLCYSCDDQYYLCIQYYFNVLF